jgi:aryl-alcohol dehydrogenase-like predicted oxidoreductase
MNTFIDIIPRGTLRLGFGCGSLHGGKGRRQSLRLLETAIDCGITYFDTGRMYGLGAAESLLGEIGSRDRHRLTITTKAGILPADQSVRMRLATRGIRLAHKFLPGSERYLPMPAAAHIRFHAFSRSALQSSVERSLKELRTDYIDILLLHECSLSDIQDPRVLEFLQDLKKQGKIRAFGIATDMEATLKIAASYAHLFSILQIPSSIFDMNIRRITSWFSGLTIVHSCLTGHNGPLLSRLATNQDMAAKWKLTTGIDYRDVKSTAKLLLAHALHVNREGIVLFSTSQVENIKSNVQAVTEPPVDLTQLEAMNDFFGAKD